MNTIYKTTRVILFIIGIIISTAFFLNLNVNRQESIESLAEDSLNKYLESSLQGISAGYFQWDEFYQAVIANDTEFIEEQFLDLLDMYEFIDSVKISEGNANEIYDLVIHNDELAVHFQIMNSNADLRLLSQVVDIHISTDLLVDSLFTEQEFEVILTENSTLQLEYQAPLLVFWHYLSIFVIGVLFQAVFAELHKFSVKRYYEIDGFKAIVDILSKKDLYTADHSEEVSELAIAIGDRLGFSKKKLQELYQAGLLHDIGKIGIDDAIINKNGKLTDEEMNQVRTHPLLGYDIVSRFPGFGKISELVLNHHELEDGSGYPNGLTADKLTLQNKILTVADIYSALTGDRPYRKAFSSDKAIEIMRSMPVNQPVLDILIKVIKE